MSRCESRYQNRNEQGEPLGSPIRCTKDAGHDDGEHRNFRPGHKIKWPDSAAMSEGAATLVSPPIPPELCGKRGPRFDGALPTGGCVYLSNHVNIEGKERHSWQGASSSSSES